MLQMVCAKNIIIFHRTVNPYAFGGRENSLPFLSRQYAQVIEVYVPVWRDISSGGIGILRISKIWLRQGITLGPYRFLCLEDSHVEGRSSAGILNFDAHVERFVDDERIFGKIPFGIPRWSKSDASGDPCALGHHRLLVCCVESDFSLADALFHSGGDAVSVFNKFVGLSGTAGHVDNSGNRDHYRSSEHELVWKRHPPPTLSKGLSSWCSPGSGCRDPFATGGGLLLRRGFLYVVHVSLGHYQNGSVMSAQ